MRRAHFSLILLSLAICAQSASAGIVYNFVNRPELAPYAISGSITFNVNPDDLPLTFDPSMVSALYLEVLDTQQPAGEQFLFALDSTTETINFPSDPPTISQTTFSLMVTPTDPFPFVGFQGATTQNLVSFGVGSVGSVTITISNSIFSATTIQFQGENFTIATRASSVPEPGGLAVWSLVAGIFSVGGLRRRLKRSTAA